MLLKDQFFVIRDKIPNYNWKFETNFIAKFLGVENYTHRYFCEKGSTNKTDSDYKYLLLHVKQLDININP